MIYDKEYCLEVWGDLACFTRPEFKVERVSYEVITPSAARAIFESIFWKPAIRWEVTKIEVLKPIRWTNIRRNEIGATAKWRANNIPSNNVIYIDKGKVRQQRNTLCLKDVRYRIWAKLVFISCSNRVYSESRNKGIDPKEEDILHLHENPTKYQAMFERRAEKGQCFTTPYFGNREFSAYFLLVNESDIKSESELVDKDRNLGLMFYDWDYSQKKPMFYNAKMENGMIAVPSLESVKKQNI